MVAFVFSIIFLIAALCLLGLRRWGTRKQMKLIQEDKHETGAFSDAKVATGIGGAGAAVAGALAILLFVWSAAAIVQPGHVKVRTFGGDIKGTIDSGWNWIPPWESTQDINVQFQTFTAAQGATSSDDRVETDAISAPTKDGSLSDVEITVRYAIDPAAAERIVEVYDNDVVSRVILPDVRTVVRDVFVRYDALDGRENREALSAEITDKLIEQWDGLLIVDSAQVRKVVLAPSVQQRADAVLEAEQRAREREFDLDTARVDAEIVRTEAEAIRDSQQIIICGASNVVQEDGRSVLVPNEGDACEEQLSDELLSWKCLETVENQATTVLFLDCGLGDSGEFTIPDVIVEAPGNNDE